MSVRAALSRINAPQARSAGSPAGNAKTFLKRCRRLDEHPEKMCQRRETVEHLFGTIKYWMGYTHFQMKTLQKVATEIALHVLAYNLKRVINIMAVAPLIATMKAA